jgi:NACalpha-BTF3-like transcription factor
MSFITWDKANFNWEEKQIIWELASFIGGGGGDFIEEIYKYDAEKKKRLISLTLKVYGNTITESKQKEIKQYKITAKDIKLIVEKANIELMAENVSF